MKIHIFYNGSDYTAPLGCDDDWGNYTNENSPRLFLACAASWEAKGWEAVRITSDVVEGFDFKGGKIESALENYPVFYWNLWYKLRELKQPVWVCNMNVMNAKFSASEADWVQKRYDSRRDYAIALHMNGWSASAMFVTPGFVAKAIQVINEVNQGKRKLPAANLIIDDRIIAQELPNKIISHPICGFPFIRDDWKSFALLHFARATITRSMKKILVR